MTREEAEKYIKSKMCNACSVCLGGGKCSDNCKVIEAIESLEQGDSEMIEALKNSTTLTQQVLVDALMEERIRGSLKSDTTFEKDIIPDVKCILTISIRDHRPCYCGAELREVWREKEIEE